LQNPPKKIRLKHRLEFLFIRFFQRLLCALPLPVVEKLGPLLGSLIWIVFPYRLKVVYTNLTLAFPEKTRAERMALAHRIYRYYGYVFLTYLVMHRPAMRRRIEKMSATGTTCIDEALVGGKGAVLAWIHYGPWEACGAWLNMNGYLTSAIYRPQKNPLTDRLFIDYRHQFGPNFRHIEKRSIGRFIKELRENRVLMVAVDQKGGKRGTPVRFFNQTTSIAKGAAFLHLRTGAPVLCGVPTVNAGKMSIEMSRLSLPRLTEVTQENVQTITAAILSHYETVIFQNPEPWFWFHRLWPKAYPKKMGRSFMETVKSLRHV